MPLYTVNRAPFFIPSHYEVHGAEGFGAFGDCVKVRYITEGAAENVKSATSSADSDNKKSFAHIATAGNAGSFVIRKFAGITQQPDDLWALLRVARLQQALGTTVGVLPLVDMYQTAQLAPQDVYAVYPLLECTLANAVYSTTPLQLDQVLMVTRELALCLRQLHANDIILGELRPEWIGINTCLSKRGDVCIQNLSSTHAVGEPLSILPRETAPILWYRAPEYVLRGSERLSTAADMWSLGCVIAEMIMRRPLFQCDNVTQYADVVSDVLGVPQNLTMFTNAHTQRFLKSLPPKQLMSLPSALPGVERQIAYLLTRMLVWDPTKRITAEELLSHAFMGAAPGQPSTKLPPITSVPKTWKAVPRDASLPALLAALECVAAAL